MNNQLPQCLNKKTSDTETMSDDEEDIKQKKTPYSPDLHLKTAIRKYERSMFLSLLGKQDLPTSFPIRKCYNAFLRKYPSLDGKFFIDSERLYGDLLNPHLTEQGRSKKYLRDFLENYTIAKNVVIASAKVTLQGIHEAGNTYQEIKDRLNRLNPSQLTQIWFVYRNLWESFRDIMKDNQMLDTEDFCTLDADIFPFKILINAYFLIIEWRQDEFWILDYSQVLMISDTISSRFLTLLYCEIQEGIGITPMLNPQEMIRFYSYGDHLLSTYGNHGYDYIKFVEPVSIAAYLAKYEALGISKGYISQLLDDLKDDPIGYQAMKKWFDLVTDLGDHPLKMIELFGCFRHFGHPTVDEIAGVESLRENSQKNITIDPYFLKLVHGAFNKMFVLEFIAQKKRWPKCTTEDGYDGPMKMLVKNRPTTISEYDLHITLNDWSTIIFEQEFIFDDFPDFTPLLSDTAISPYLQNWFSVFNKDLLSVNPPESIEESRRVLLEILRREEIDCKSIRIKIQNREVPLEWLVIGLHSKERELKIKARLFAMMVLEMRLYFNMTEKNIAEKIFPFIPYQTMTWSDSDLMKTMLRLSSLYSKKSSNRLEHYLPVIISLDFNKFNQRWRYESTYPIFNAIDNLLGTPGLLTYSHEFFQKAFFFLSSSLRPPDHITRKTSRKTQYREPLEQVIFNSETTWLGQGGGCEGLRQKGWTAIIISAIVANADRTGISGSVIGQGDNQVIVILLPLSQQSMTLEEYVEKHEQEISIRIKNYLTSLEEITKGIGMELKLQETWVSTKLLNYGKEILIDGSFASNSIKKISRAYQEISELHPSIQNRVASIFTTAQSTSMKSFDNYAPYLIAVLDTLNMLSKESRYGTTMARRLAQLYKEKQVKLDQHLKYTALFLPRECGGLPVIPFINLMFRGHPDSATSSLCWLKIMGDEFPQAKMILDMISSGSFFDTRADYVQLIQDPYSLNFTRPVQSTGKIKHMLTNKLNEVTNNQIIRLMLDNCNDDSLREVTDYLMKSEPLLPRVLNEILRLSPDGALLSFLSVFKDMRTMKQILSPREANSLLDQLQQGDVETIRVIVEVSKKINHSTIPRLIQDVLGIDPSTYLLQAQSCTTTLAQSIRVDSWGVKIQGVTTPHPLEQSHLYLAQDDYCTYPGCTGEEMIVYVVIAERKNHQESLHMDKGPLTHYLGSGTTEKRSGPVLNYPKTERALRASQQLQRVLSWVVDPNEQNNTFPAFLKNLIQSRCDANEEFLILTAGVNYGGSIQHRFSDVTSKHESRPGIRVNNHSRIMITSDQLGKYARGKDNYPIIFQSLYLLAMNQINTHLMFNPECLQQGNLVFHQHLTCKGCVFLLTEPLVTNSKTPPYIPILKSCPLIFSSLEKDVCKMPLNCLENCPAVSPSQRDPNIMRKAAYAAAVIILGEVSHVVTPLVHSNIRYRVREGSLACLTVGFFAKIGMINLFSQIAKVWVLENIPLIVDLSLQYQCDLLVSVGMILDRYPDDAWEILKPYLCLEEIQREARIALGLNSSSSEIFLTGRGLGYAISSVVARVAKRLLSKSIDNPEQRIELWRLPFISTTPSFSLARASYLWVNSIILAADWKNKEDLKVFVDLAKNELLQATKPTGVELNTLMIALSNWKLGDTTFTHAITSNRVYISKVGVEPWVIPNLLPDKKVLKTKAVLIPAPSTIDSDIRVAILVIQSSLGVRTNLSLLPQLEEGSCLLPTFVKYPERSDHTRSDHFFRIVGEYSTAGLKYTQMFSLISDNLEGSVGVHLAEGAAGVGRTYHKLFRTTEIIYNSLVEIGPNLNHRAYRFLPAELQDLQGVQILGPSYCYQTGGDITVKSTIDRYRMLIKKKKHQIKIITCDAEFPNEGSISMARNLISSYINIIQDSNKGTYLIFKTFCRMTELLQHQVCIWVQSVDNPRVITPNYSSHEASEIFLFGESKGYIVDPIRFSKLSADNKILTDDIAQARKSPVPFLYDANLETLQDLYFFYHHIGVKINVHVALHIFLNYSVSIEDLEDNLLRSLATAVDQCHMRCHARANALFKMSSAQDMTLQQKLIVDSIRQESRELHIAVETLFNVSLLRHLLLKSDIPSDLFLSKWVLSEDGKIIYEYVPDWQKWVVTYGRSFYKILGYLVIIKNRKLQLPEFISSTLTGNRSI